MKKIAIAIALTATTLAAGAASAGNTWHHNGKICFKNAYGYIQCVYPHQIHTPAPKPHVVIVTPKPTVYTYKY